MRGDDHRVAVRVGVTGLVQGIGFRPFVHRLAARLGVAGWVRNRSGDVEIQLEGSPTAVERFLDRLTREAPPLARVTSLISRSAADEGNTAFAIRESAPGPGPAVAVSPDIATCQACEAELFDPTNRRYRYPFITCTDCGPRYSVIEAMPYDRERTAMHVFQQCPVCATEYTTPHDRRYHSESNSCRECGPCLFFRLATHGESLSCSEAGHVQPDSDAAVAAAAERLLAGDTIAVRGIGGFQLAVDATSEDAVLRLRRRKSREAKPLAVMVRTLEEARTLGRIGREEATLLRSRARPIVLLEARAESPLAPSVSAALGTVGVMLAASPLHHLLLDAVRRPLVMTSGNASDEPIAAGNDEASIRLAPIADGFLTHDRDIVSRSDDSVVRVVSGSTVMLRRARGFAPLEIEMPVEVKQPILAVGPHLKNTFCLAYHRSAWPSPHIGDLESLETLHHFQATLDRYRTLFGIEPEVTVRDLHPGYLSTRLAEEMPASRIVAVQHHHAHIAAVSAENAVTGPVLGIAFDGTGYGDDGHVWGAEFLLSDLGGYHRLAQLRYAPLPGGDLAARLPWRAALGYLSLEEGAASAFDAAFDGIDPTHVAVARRQIERNLNAPLASSMGRLFDAAAAVTGIARISQFEGHAAMRLESAAGRRKAAPLPFPIVEGTDQHRRWILDPLPLLHSLGELHQKGVAPEDLAARFHESVAESTAELAGRLAATCGIREVALGGGVFQNARLLATLRARLEERRLRVLTAVQLPPNDGGISYGQCVVAATRLAAEM
jgi:hydrogenase maturation protein HypF